MLGLDDTDVQLPPEEGESFLEIAATKALAAAEQSGMLSLADDSGLEVSYLGGGPGVRSARYAGEPADRCCQSTNFAEGSLWCPS